MYEHFRRRLQPVVRRQGANYVLRAAAGGLTTGAMAAIVLAVLRVIERTPSAWTGWGMLLGFPVVVALVAAVWRWRRRDLLPAARAVDTHYELKDRTETALAFLRRPAGRPRTDFEELQLLDAIQQLERVEPRQVEPLEWPQALRWALVTTVVAVTLLCWPIPQSDLNAGPAPPLEAVVAEAERIEEDLAQLREDLPEGHDPEIDALIAELLEKTEEMQQPGVAVREALAKLSEMQAALQAMAAKLNVAATDEALKAIGEALQSAKALQESGEALQAGQYDKAAEELAKLDNLPLDRKESRAVSEKLKQASEHADQKGLKKLSEAARETANGLDQDNAAQSKQGLKKLAELARQHAHSKKIGELLKRQNDKLAESKAHCQANNQGTQPGNKPSLKAGKGTNATVQGHRTELAAKRQEEKIQGQKGDQGDSDVETLSTHEANEQARRNLKEVYHQYRKLSEAVLEAEDIPLGHRQTIRRYFEAIRPTRDDDESPPGPKSTSN